MESAAKIKEILQAASMEKLPEFIAEYENDPRSGVQKLVSGALKKIDALCGILIVLLIHFIH